MIVKSKLGLCEHLIIISVLSAPIERNFDIVLCEY